MIKESQNAKSDTNRVDNRSEFQKFYSFKRYLFYWKLVATIVALIVLSVVFYLEYSSKSTIEKPLNRNEKWTLFFVCGIIIVTLFKRQVKNYLGGHTFENNNVGKFIVHTYLQELDISFLNPKHSKL